MTLLKDCRTKCLSMCPPTIRVWAKERAELSFWRSRHENEQVLRNDHYRFFYTDFFKLTDEDYRGYRILDVGCGPRGSLEWADMALERIGLDPLVDRYRALGIDKHSMSYCHAPVEAIPYESDYFDRVVSFNSLDHVDNLFQALSEINRVTKQGGLFLLIVEVNHPPTPTEPVELTEADLKSKLLETYDVQLLVRVPITQRSRHLPKPARRYPPSIARNWREGDHCGQDDQEDRLAWRRQWRQCFLCGEG